MERSNTFSKLKEHEKNARRDIIINAAEKEFAVKPFNRVNMRDIAKKAGISAASIYRYFPDQESLFVETFVRGTKDIFIKLHKTIDESNDGDIETVTEEFIVYFSKNDQYFKMLMRFFLSDSVEKDIFEKLSSIERSLLNDFDSIFSKLQKKKKIRYDSHSFFASLVGIVATFRNHPDKNEDEVIKYRTKIALNIAHLFKASSEQ